MQHHHYVRAARQRRGVASLLVAAVTAVLVMPERLDPKLLGQFGGIVQTCIVYQYYVINNIVREFVVRPLQRLRGVIGGKNDDNFFIWVFADFSG
jgi:hypothetical protein